MDKFECFACGYIYDPEIGTPEQDIDEGTAFNELPGDWVCPQCGADFSYFRIIDV